MDGRRVTPAGLLSVAALLAGAGIFFHLVVTVPQRERARQDLVRRWISDHQALETDVVKRSYRQQEFARGLLLNTCIEEAAAARLDAWTRTCKLQDLPANCVLPATLSGELEEAARQRRLECFTKYPPPR